MIESFLEYFILLKWGFLAGILFAWSIAFTAPFIVLRKNALFPHAITHVLFFSIIFSVFALKIQSSFLIYLINLIVISLAISGIVFIKRYLKLYEDTATSLITHFAFALALIISSKVPSYETKISSYLFGSFLTIEKDEFFLSIITLITTLLFYKKFSSLWISQITDTEIPGINFGLSNFSFLILLSLQITIGINIMGVLLVTMFFVASTSVALQIGNSLKNAILLTGFLNTIALFLGAFFSIVMDIPFSAGCSVILFSFLFILIVFRVFFVKKLKK